MRRRFLRMAFLLFVLLAGVVSASAARGATATERPAATVRPIPVAGSQQHEHHGSQHVDDHGSSTLPAQGPLVDPQITPVVTFPLTVSLEWQPGSADSLPSDLALSGCTPVAGSVSYTADLVEGLRQMSGYLYRYSRGKMALGKVTIYTGGQHWNDADIRVLANSAYRPAAFVGGIVKTPTTYTSSPLISKPVFQPREILLGRLFDGKGARCGAWSEPEGWRSLGHEFGHYALYMWDEYFNYASGAVQFCSSGATTPLTFLSPGQRASSQTNTDANTLMAYQYTTNHLVITNPTPLGNCGGTPQMVFNGVSDWETILRFYPAIPSLPSPGVGPDFLGSPAANLFQWTVVPATAPVGNRSARVKLQGISIQDPVAQAYLVRKNGSGDPQIIVGQGESIAGASAPLPLWGLQGDGNDGVAVLLNDAETQTRYYNTQGPASIVNVNTLKIVAAQESPWQGLDLQVTPVLQNVGGFQQVTGIQVHLADGNFDTHQVRMAYCPAGGTCQTPVTVTRVNAPDDPYDHTFTVSPKTTHGYIYVRNLDPLGGPSSVEETLTWFQVAGSVGPAGGGYHAPLAEGLLNVEVPAGPLAAEQAGGTQPAQATDHLDSRVIYNPAQRDTPPLPIISDFSSDQQVTKTLRLVGTPIDIHVMLAGQQDQQIPWKDTDPPLRVRLFYNQDLLNRLDIPENLLQLVHVIPTLGPNDRGWEFVNPQTISQSLELDWLSGEALRFGGPDGIGEVWALAVNPFQIADDPPETFITDQPSNPSFNNRALFRFIGTDQATTSAEMRFECQLDGGGFAPCTSPQDYVGVTNGEHIFEVRAIDLSEKVDESPDIYEWTVETISAPPDTSITAGPLNPSASTAASFSFTGSDDTTPAASLTFECQLDGGGFTPCTSPRDYGDLAEGPHTFEVRALDAEGNVDVTPASFAWTIDTTAPDTTITAHPPLATLVKTASFSFSGTDILTLPENLTFECQLDGGGFTPCTSPQNYNDLAGGPHTFDVRAIDAAGNVDPTPASFTWTVVNSCADAVPTIVGTDGNDVLIGTDGPDIIFGLGGNNRIDGRGGDDLICGGDGRDRIDGGAGDDIIEGGAGNDQLEGGLGNNTLKGGDGDDRLEGENGDDTLDGGNGDDRLEGENGDDTLDGGNGDDRLEGENGDDTIFGGDGDDFIEGGNGDDIIDGGDGRDRINGDNGNDTIHGGAGNDNLHGNNDNDTIFGDDGNDWIEAGKGDDIIEGGNGDDGIDGDNGNDTIHGGSGNDTLDGGNDNDTVFGEDGDDFLEGGNGDDTLDGGSGDDGIDGDNGIDTIHGGIGNDTLDGGNDNDAVFGDDGDDFLDGGNGDDTLDGGNDNDRLRGGSGDDTLTGGAGRDSFNGESGIDTATDFNPAEGDILRGVEVGG